MADSKSEQIKLVIVVVMAFVLVGIVYMRFVRPKSQATAPGEAAPASTASLEVPEVALDMRETPGWRNSPQGPPEREPLRDIFVPNGLPKGQGSAFPGTEESVPIDSLELRGVVAGGARPVALINDRFVRLGEQVYQYRVASIGAKEVWLASGMETYQLRILKGE